MVARMMRRPVLQSAALLALAALLCLAVGCSGNNSGGTGGGAAGTPAPNPSMDNQTSKPAPADPTYSKWIVYINDDDSYTKSGITYSIALNLKATNPGSKPTGKYTGKATAKTDSTGTYRGQQLNASAIANSSHLQFTLEEGASDDLAALTTDTVLYHGSGTIAMKASGSGTYGRAGGPFGNNSSQPIQLDGINDKVTLTVVIDGHRYKFNGTLRGE
jgi:hypothetical protein